MRKVRVTKVNFDDGTILWRAELVGSNGAEVFEIGTSRVAKGFGLTALEALKDFVKRNHFDVMNEIYKERQNASTNNKGESSANPEAETEKTELRYTG